MNTIVCFQFDRRGCAETGERGITENEFLTSVNLMTSAIDNMRLLIRIRGAMEIHEGKVVKIVPNNGIDALDGARFIFYVQPVHQYFAYYTKPVNSPDGGASLKTVLYFLLESDLRQAARWRYRHLIGRYINLHLVEEIRKSRLVPIIRGFSFSTRQLFSYNGQAGRLSRGRRCPKGGRQW